MSDHSGTLLNAIHDMQMQMMHFNHTMNRVADVLEDVGSDKMAKTIDDATEDLNVSWKRVYDAHGEHIAGTLRDSMVSTSNMMAAVFAGMSSKGDEKEQEAAREIAKAFVFKET